MLQSTYSRYLPAGCVAPRTPNSRNQRNLHHVRKAYKILAFEFIGVNTVLESTSCLLAQTAIIFRHVSRPCNGRRSGTIAIHIHTASGTRLWLACTNVCATGR
ncbi:hypothetical protein PAXRUDRAFT_367967 [Paxillus rubicundulus Ve08.2h10]|uniref:Uncharacterized protein n=1 Tax=Paxillus rubicundulus Ve08.2h10 TaxID=930991 RepID=A0A0D0C3B7_9AGAM|nr:hypothetical protein PAXRUDRAFT_367967 [Paxillus rubicundulus Ve08.2h10]